MMLILPLLFACQSASPDPDSPATPETNLPSWSGTQIGEEGDLFCAYVEQPWDTATAEASLWDPTTLLDADRWSGTFQAEIPDASADLVVTISDAGAPLALVTPNKLPEDCPIGVLLPVTLEFSAPPLLDVEVEADVMAIELISLAAVLGEDALSGELSPGILPEDAGALTLELSGVQGTGWSGGARWILERPDGAEAASAGEWSVQ